MLLFRQPTAHQIRNFLNDQSVLHFSYAEVGATEKKRISGYNNDRYRTQLGAGQECWERACKALRDWKMFSLEWVQLCWPFARLRPYEMVAVLASHYGFRSLNAARIVYVIDEPRRFGFAYGTMPDHLEQGEERFQVEWLEDDTVWYEIFSFSRPRHWLAWLAYPLSRAAQKRFADDSMEAMEAAVIPGLEELRSGPLSREMY